MKVRHTTRKAKYTLSRILNNDFLRWLDLSYQHLRKENAMPNCKHCKKQFPQARFDALEGQPSQSITALTTPILRRVWCAR
jgi:hypothetical protein